MIADSSPVLSVILTATSPLSRATATIRSLGRQCRGRRVQLIIAFNARPSASETGEGGASNLLSLRRRRSGLESARVSAASELLFVRLASTATLPQLLGTALDLATGEIIAITDAAYEVAENWVEAVLKAHDTPRAIIGGAVVPGRLLSLVDWTAYFCDYGQFLPPLPDDPAAEVAGCNLSFQRNLLTRGREFVSPEFWKTYWCRLLQAESANLYLDASIVVTYQKSVRFGPFLGHRFHSGRCFAGMRNRQLSGGKRWLYGVSSPLLALLFTARQLQNLWPKGRCRRALFSALPLLFMANLCWAIGEGCGYLLGAGGSYWHVR